MKDYYSDKLRKKEKAEEDRYFAQHDRDLIEQLHKTSHPDARSTEGGEPVIPDRLPPN